MIIEGRLANEGDGWARSGANPWHLDDETESVLFLTNMGEAEARIGFRVDTLGVPYFLTDLKLTPHETQAIDIRKLRDAQQPDFQGNKIPASASDGGIYWIRLDDVPVMGRLVVLQHHKGTASSYSCQICPCPANITAVNVTPAPADMLVGSTCQMKATEQTQDCNGITYYSTVTGSSTWSSNNTAVATVNNSTSKGLVTAVSAGAATVSGMYSSYTYTFSTLTGCHANTAQRTGSATARSRKAKWAVLTGDTTNSSFTCLNGTKTVKRDRTYDAYDDYGIITFSEDWKLNETVTSTSSCNMTTDGTSSFANFVDTINNCTTNCTFESNQTFTITNPNNNTTVTVRAKDSTTATTDHVGWHVKATTSGVTITDN